MRVVPAGLEPLYDGTQTATLAWFMRVTRTDTTVYGFTSAQRDVEIGGVDYLAGPGLEVANLVSTAGFAVDNTELTILADDTIITVPDILAGRWNNAAFVLFRASWADKSLGIDVHKAGTFGTVQPANGAFTVELRGLQQYLQQPIGAASTKTCRARLGDAKCRKDLTAFTVTGTLTSVTSQQVFADTGRSEADDYFGNGLLTWTGGDNIGITAQVKTYVQTGGVITLSVPAVAAVQVGDTYSLVAGCRKRVDEDCRDKFANILNFQGEPHRPTIDELTASPEANAE
jgi:uncharacterized phage protein (TIGR02218 family)